MVRSSWLAAAAILAAAPAAAPQGESLAPHVHGVGTLDIAIDPEGGAAVIALMTPGYNLFGFERAPRTEAEAEAAAAAEAALSEGAGLFELPDGAGCALEAAEIEGLVTALAPEGDSHSGEHDGHDHDHDHDSHDHGDHDHGHDRDGHDHGHGGSSANRDILAEWTFACEDAGALTRLDAGGLFAAFNRFERVDATLFDGERAAVATLTAEGPAIAFD